MTREALQSGRAGAGDNGKCGRCLYPCFACLNAGVVMLSPCLWSFVAVIVSVGCKCSVCVLRSDGRCSWHEHHGRQ